MKRTTRKITVDFVNENFYEIDGMLYAKFGKANSLKQKNGYYMICYRGKSYKSHRILWILYNQQEIPDGMFIDHIDGNRGNNSKENLRLATLSQNAHNMKMRSNNKIGIKGININKFKSNIYYQADIRCDKKRMAKKFSYTPEGLESAKKWIEEKRKELHGEFARDF